MAKLVSFISNLSRRRRIVVLVVLIGIFSVLFVPKFFNKEEAGNQEVLNQESQDEQEVLGEETETSEEGGSIIQNTSSGDQAETQGSNSSNSAGTTGGSSGDSSGSSNNSPSPSPSPTPTPVADPLCTPNSSISCPELSGIYSDGSAVCRPDGSGYDLSSCQNTSLLETQVEMVKPAERDSSLFANARCNDGTPFGFEFRKSPSASKNWVIYLEGGGMCEDNAKSCVGRPSTHTSTSSQADRSIFESARGGIFSTDSSKNSQFHDANLVFAHYCSSDGWSGATAERRPVSADINGWYFSGKHNVRETVRILKQRYGLDDNDSSTKVLFAGGSAGGDGVYVNAEDVKNLLSGTASRGLLKLVADGSWINNFDDSNYRPGTSGDPLYVVAEKAYAFWGSSLNSICENSMASAGKNVAKCFMGKEIYGYITNPAPNGLGLPLLVQLSRIDSYMLGLHHIDNPIEDEAAYLAWYNLMNDELGIVQWLFSGADSPYHTILTKDGSNGWEMGTSEESSFRSLLFRFWDGSAAERILFGNP